MTVMQRLVGARATVLALLGSVLILLTASPAAAQGTFVCPNGPGPGERQVGITGGSHGVAAVPICVSDNPQEPAAPRVQMRAVDNFYAAAWHPDSNDAWIVAGYLDKGRAAQAALSACTKVMGSGCTLATSNVNGTVVIARGVEGHLYSSDRAKRGDAEKAVKDYCRKQNDECEVINWVSTSPGSAEVGARVYERIDVYAPRGNPRRTFGALAWVVRKEMGNHPWTGDVWVVGGRPNADKAKSDALALCQADMPAGCTVVLIASDVFVSVTERDGVAVSAASGATVGLADKRALEVCKTKKGKCRVTATIGLSQDIAYRFDPFAQGKPHSTAQAWIKGDTAPWQNSVWTVSGAKDEASAKAAALSACKKESKLECEIGSNSFNTKVALYIDQTGYIRVSWMNLSADPSVYVQKRCAETKVTCKLVKVVDSRVPLTERVEVK